MARAKQPKAVHQLTAAQFDALFQTEGDCIRYLVARRWPQGVVCPRCGNPQPSEGTGGMGKSIVIGAVKRKGNVVARVINNLKGATLTEFVGRAVSHKVSLLCTDEATGYRRLAKEYPLHMVDHARGQYVIGAVHTQTIEGFWSLIKSGAEQ